MKTKLLWVIGAAALGVAATAQAHGSSGTYAAPSQPIPYSQLDNYLHASPSQRASMDFSGAATGTATNTSAAMGSTPMDNSTSSQDMSTTNPTTPTAPATSATPNNGVGSSAMTNPSSVNPGPSTGSNPSPK